MGWQWHQLDHMQIICTSLQTDNHFSTLPLSFYRPDALPVAKPTVSKHWRHKILYRWWVYFENVQTCQQHPVKENFTASFVLHMILVVNTIAGILRPRYGSSTARPMTGLSSMSLWIIISVIGGITVVAVGLVIGVLCYRKCTKKQQPSHQNVYVLICVRTQPYAV